MYKVFMVKTYVLVEMAVRTDKAPGIPAKKKKKKKFREKFDTTKTTNTVMLISFL